MPSYSIEKYCIYCNKEITPEQSVNNGGYCSKEHDYLHFKEIMDESYELYGCEVDVELER